MPPRIDEQLNQLCEFLYDSPVGVLCLTRSGDCVNANQGIANLMDTSPAHLYGKQLRHFLTDSNWHNLTSTIEDLVTEGSSCAKVILKLRHRQNATLRTLHCKLHLLAQPPGSEPLVLLICLDVTQYRHDELQLKLFSSAVENSGSGVLITNAEGFIQYANPRFCDITGYDPEELKGQMPSILKSQQNDPAVYLELWNTLTSGRRWRGMLLNKRKNDTLYWAFQSISPVQDEHGRITHYVSVSDDITELKEKEQEMSQLALFDPLTQLGNRRAFRDCLEHLLQKNDGQMRALLLLDMDHFKQINDTLGHEAGDMLLRTLANRLRFAASQPERVFRLGGDEFTMVITAESQEQICDFCKELINVLAQPVQLDVHELSITVSIGITMVGTDSQNVSGLLRNADLAMYHAKHKGRNNFQFFEPEMHHAARQMLTMEHDLRQALIRDELYLVYQPQVCLKTGQPTGVEALLRWLHPSEGLVPPDEFIPRAEETGLILQIGNWVLKEAFQAAYQLYERLPEHKLRMAINLSVRQLEDPSLVHLVRTLLRSIPVPAHLIQLEVTEGALMQNPQQAIQTMQQLRDLGIELAIDDFGTGYSSLTQLKKMPLDELKIDRSFIKDIPYDSDDIAITSTILAMASQLGMKVVAEGIETEEHLNFLQEAGCQYGQGYLFSRPISLCELIEWTKNHQLSPAKAAIPA